MNTLFMTHPELLFSAQFVMRSAKRVDKTFLTVSLELSWENLAWWMKGWGVGGGGAYPENWKLDPSTPKYPCGGHKLKTAKFWKYVELMDWAFWVPESYSGVILTRLVPDCWGSLTGSRTGGLWPSVAWGSGSPRGGHTLTGFGSAALSCSNSGGLCNLEQRGENQTRKFCRCQGQKLCCLDSEWQPFRTEDNLWFCQWTRKPGSTGFYNFVSCDVSLWMNKKHHAAWPTNPWNLLHTKQPGIHSPEDSLVKQEAVTMRHKRKKTLNGHAGLSQVPFLGALNATYRVKLLILRAKIPDRQTHLPWPRYRCSPFWGGRCAGPRRSWALCQYPLSSSLLSVPGSAYSPGTACKKTRSCTTETQNRSRLCVQGLCHIVFGYFVYFLSLKCRIWLWSTD